MDAGQQYLRGFNSGYFLAEHGPGLLSKILTGLAPTTAYLEGLFSGREEYVQELARIHQDDLTRLRNQGRDRETDLERDL